MTDQEVFDKIDSLNYSVAEFKNWVNKGAGGTLPKDALSLDANDRFEEYADKFIEYKQSLQSLVIDESNFDQYFFDANKCRPQPGQVLACYETYADFIDGNLKRDILHLLTTKDNFGTSAARLMEKLAYATQESAIKVIKQMIADLLNGMSTDDVAKKPYEFHFKRFFYTYRECVPTDDPRWWSASLIDVRHSLDF